jgi:ribose-phosphate pyrophosphokinase
MHLTALERLRLFVPHGTETLGEKIALALGCSLAALEERSFEDGEHKIRPLETVAGRDVYVVHSLHGGPDESPNDKLCKLLFFIAALKDAGAARVTAVTPYLCYARKDRRTKAYDPVTIRYLATMFEAVGVDAVVTLEVHNESAFENAFRCPSIALSTAPLRPRLHSANPLKFADNRIDIVRNLYKRPPKPKARSDRLIDQSTS